MADRRERIHALLHALAAEFVAHESNRRSMITVTRVATSRDLSKATIFLTVYPEAQEKAALDFLKRKRPQLRAFIKSRAALKRIPFVEIAIDRAEKARQRLDALLLEEKGASD